MYLHFFLALCDFAGDSVFQGPNSTPPETFVSILANAKPAPAAARQRAVVSHCCFCWWCWCWTQWRNSKVIHKKKSCQPQHCKFWPHQKKSCTETNSKSVKLLFIDSESEMLVSMLIEIHVLISLHLSLHCGQTSNSKALSLCAKGHRKGTFWLNSREVFLILYLHFQHCLLLVKARYI